MAVPLVLALDTCGHACSLALVDQQGNAAFNQTDWMARGHGAALPAVAAKALEAVDPKQVQGVVITRGPGGFTGMRAGLAYARAFALARAIPAFGISVDQALRLTVPAQTPIAIDSRRGDAFVAGQVFSAAQVAALPGPVAGSFLLADATAHVGWHEPCPKAMATYGWAQLNMALPPDSASLEPLYIRAPSVG